MTIPDYRRVSFEDYEDYIEGASTLAGHPRSFSGRSKLLTRTDRLLDKMNRELGGNNPRVALMFAPQARNEPLVPVPLIADRALKALGTAQYDWLTPASLAKQLEVSEADVRATLAALGAKVRRPIGASGRECDYYCLSSKPPTWQERVRKLRALITFTPLAESNY